MTARCEHTQLPLGECAERCCRPDLKQYQPVPEVWMRVTEAAPTRPVVPTADDVRTGNVHALFQVVSDRTGRPEVLDMVRELCEPSSHLVRYLLEESSTTRRGTGSASNPGEKREELASNQRRKKGRARRQKAGRKALRPPRYHRTVEPPLLEQLYASVTPSSSAEAGVSRPSSSRPAARLDAIDTANRIDTQAGIWLYALSNEAAPIDPIARIRKVASLLPSVEHCGRRTAQRDSETKAVRCCLAHHLEADIGRWWTWARVVTGWDTPAWQPDNTCPLCGTRGTLRVRLDEQRATCINDACRETWDDTNIGLLADHIRHENNEDEENAS